MQTAQVGRELSFTDLEWEQRAVSAVSHDSSPDQARVLCASVCKPPSLCQEDELSLAERGVSQSLTSDSPQVIQSCVTDQTFRHLMCCGKPSVRPLQLIVFSCGECLQSA